MTLGTVSGLGTGGTASVTGSDDAGIFGFTTGTGAGTAQIFLDFSASLYGTSGSNSGGPFVRYYPLNAAASGVAGGTNIDASNPAHLFLQVSGIADSTTYTWSYKIF